MSLSCRLETGTCLMHPYFWDHRQRRTFLLIALERSGAISQDAVDPELRTLEQHERDALSVDQLSRLDELFMEHLDEFRKYDGKLLEDVFHPLAKRCAPFPLRLWIMPR